MYIYIFLLSRTMQPDDCGGQQARLDLRDDIKTIYSYTRTYAYGRSRMQISPRTSAGGGQFINSCAAHESNGRSSDDAATKLSRRRDVAYHPPCGCVRAAGQWRLFSLSPPP